MKCCVCHCNKPDEDFIGVNGVVKSCIRCRMQYKKYTVKRNIKSNEYYHNKIKNDEEVKGRVKRIRDEKKFNEIKEGKYKVIMKEMKGYFRVIYYTINDECVKKNIKKFKFCECKRDMVLKEVYEFMDGL